MERTGAIAALAVALSPQRLSRLQSLLLQIVPEPVPVAVAYEILLQSHLFFGFAQTLEAVRIFAETLPTDNPAGGYAEAESLDTVQLKRRGQKLCEQVYTPNFDRLMTGLTKCSPELAEWMIVDGYGKVLSRPGPTPLEREVASIVFLAISGHPVQLYSHVRAARNLGATPESIQGTLAHCGLSKEQMDIVNDRVQKVFGR